jgi:heme exporter protein A
MAATVDRRRAEGHVLWPIAQLAGTAVQAGSMEAIACSQLSQRFGSRWIWSRLELRLMQGTRLLLTGDNGAGKTTLLRVLATALRPSRGQLRLLGQPVWPHGLAVRRHLALVTHQHYLYEGLSAVDNLRYVQALAGARAACDLNAVLEKVGLAHVGLRPMATFSAGMKRRLALARLLVLRPSLVFLDEPFAQLDPGGQDVMSQLIEQMGQGGATLVIASHDIERARRLCTHGLHLAAGDVAPRVVCFDALATAARSV